MDLSVYDHSGVQVKEDPRLTPEYKAKVVEGLGFASEWSVRHPELTEGDACAQGRGFLVRGFPSDDGAVRAA